MPHERPSNQNIPPQVINFLLNKFLYFARSEILIRTSLSLVPMLEPTMKPFMVLRPDSDNALYLYVWPNRTLDTSVYRGQFARHTVIIPIKISPRVATSACRDKSPWIGSRTENIAGYEQESLKLVDRDFYCYVKEVIILS